MEKVGLTIKTKVAAWLMTLVGILIGGGSLFVFILSVIALSNAISSNTLWDLGGVALAFFVSIVTFPIGLLYFYFSLLLLKGKKCGWWFSVPFLLFSILVFYWTLSITPIYPQIIILCLLSASFLLLIIDWKNFWKIAK